jgi:peroxiredoxin
MGDDGAPKAGQIAPTFSLKAFDGQDEVALAGFRGKQPVVLFFGSYT